MAGLVDGKVAVITGGSSGIGRATAFALAREGAAAVIVADVRKDPERAADPDAVADAIVFLCSPLSRYITGASLVVDGGIINMM